MPEATTQLRKPYSPTMQEEETRVERGGIAPLRNSVTKQANSQAPLRLVTSWSIKLRSAQGMAQREGRADA